MVTKFFFLGLAVSICCGQLAFGNEQVDALAWHGLQNYDVAALKKVADLQVGKFVGVRCHYRSKRIQRLRASWYEAMVWQNTPQDNRKPFNYIRVKIARKDLPAFESLPTDFRGGPPMIIYGQVQQDSESSYLRLVGDKVTRDAMRNAIVSW